MVCLRFNHLKGVMKDHQKKSELKTPKINPIFDVFSKFVLRYYQILLSTMNLFFLSTKN